MKSKVSLAKLAETAVLSVEVADRLAEQARSFNSLSSFIKNRYISESTLKKVIDTAVQKQYLHLTFPALFAHRPDLSEDFIRWAIETHSDHISEYAKGFANLNNTTKTQVEELVTLELSKCSRVGSPSSFLCSTVYDEQLATSLLDRFLVQAKQARNGKNIFASPYLRGLLSNPSISFESLEEFFTREGVGSEAALNLLPTIFLPRFRDEAGALKFYDFLHALYGNHRSIRELRAHLLSSLCPPTRLIARLLVRADKLSQGEMRALTKAAKHYPVYELLAEFSFRRSGIADLPDLVDASFGEVCRVYLSDWANIQAHNLPASYVIKLAESEFQMTEDLIINFPHTEHFTVSSYPAEDGYRTV